MANQVKKCGKLKCVIRVGIVGLNWGFRVAEAIQRVPALDLVACYARTPVTRQAFARRYDCQPVASYEELIGIENLDGVIIMTPNSTHCEYAIAALRADRHVLVTKPIAHTIPAAAEMIRVAREKGLILAVGHQSRRHPALRALKRIVDSGELGKLRMIEGNTSSPTGLAFNANNWRRNSEECPGGPLMQLGIHYIDVFQHLLGPIKSVSAWLSGPCKRTTPLTGGTLLKFSSGVMGYLGSSYVAPYTRWIRLLGDRGTAIFEANTGLFHKKIGEESRTVIAISEGEEENLLSQMLAEEVSEFAECIRKNTVPEIGGEFALNNLAVVLAAVDSNERGTSVTVDE